MLWLDGINGAHDTVHEIPDEYFVLRWWLGCGFGGFVILGVPEEDFAQHFEVQSGLGFSDGNTHIFAGTWYECDKICGHSNLRFEDDAAEAIVMRESTSARIIRQSGKERRNFYDIYLQQRWGKS